MKAERMTALREIARSFLKCAGMTAQGELARVTGLSRPDAGLGNRALVEEGFAISSEAGSYHLKLFADELSIWQGGEQPMRRPAVLSSDYRSKA